MEYDEVLSELSDKNMRGEKIFSVLKIISETSGKTAEVFRKFFKDDRGQATAGPTAKQRYYNLISHLKHDNLIAEDRKKRDTLKLTNKGWGKLLKFQKASFYHYPDPDKYERISGDPVIIISFDVREKMRSKRRWLRDVLKNLGLRKIQQSVWLGKGRVPKEFLEDIRKMNLVEAVEIFEVSRAGSLRHVL